MPQGGPFFLFHRPGSPESIQIHVLLNAVAHDGPELLGWNRIQFDGRWISFPFRRTGWQGEATTLVFRQHDSAMRGKFAVTLRAQSTLLGLILCGTAAGSSLAAEAFIRRCSPPSLRRDTAQHRR